MSARLEGQVALLTGGATGIGAAVVARYIEEGARVGVLVRDVQLFAAVHADAGIIALFDGLPSGLDGRVTTHHQGARTNRQRHRRRRRGGFPHHRAQRGQGRLVSD